MQKDLVAAKKMRWTSLFHDGRGPGWVPKTLLAYLCIPDLLPLPEESRTHLIKQLVVASCDMQALEMSEEDINFNMDDGNTALHFAVKYGHNHKSPSVEAVQALVSAS